MPYKYNEKNYISVFFSGFFGEIITEDDVFIKS